MVRRKADFSTTRTQFELTDKIDCAIGRVAQLAHDGTILLRQAKVLFG